MFKFNVEVDLECQHLIINKKIRVCRDHSSNIVFLDGSVEFNYGTKTFTTLEAAGILGVIVKDIEYDQSDCSDVIWYAPSYVLFEKNGTQLEIQYKNYQLKWELKEVKHNHKIKHTDKIRNDEGVTYDYKTGEIYDWAANNPYTNRKKS